MMEALLLLVDTVQNFGLFKDHAHRVAIVRVVLERFAKEISDSLVTAERPSTIQFLWDLYFLRTICEDWGDMMTDAVTSLNQSISVLQEVCRNVIDR